MIKMDGLLIKSTKYNKHKILFRPKNRFQKVQLAANSKKNEKKSKFTYIIQIIAK